MSDKTATGMLRDLTGAVDQMVGADKTDAKIEPDYQAIYFERKDLKRFMDELDRLKAPATSMSIRTSWMIGEIKRLRFALKNRDQEIENLTAQRRELLGIEQVEE